MPTTTESLKLQIESLKADKQKLEIENGKLKRQLTKEANDENAGLDHEEAVQLQSKIEELEEKAKELEKLYEEERRSRSEEVRELEERVQQEVEGRIEQEQRAAQLQEDLECQQKQVERLKLEIERIENERRGWNEQFVNQEEKIEQLSVANEELSQELSEVKRQNESGHFESELKVYRAVEVERKRWEAREEQILRLKTFASGSGDAIATPVLRANAEEFTPRRTCSSPERRQETESSLVITPAQLPPVPKFSGDSLKDDVENFTEWLEQFNLVAEVCQWNNRARLVNLVTRLKGSAYAFYRTCSPDQRSDYEKLTLELEKRFMPVRIPVVDTSMFHERKQQDKETVDASMRRN